MDLLFTRYADPFSLLNGVIQIGRFSDFINEFIEIENEKNLWDYYLHKVFNKSFAEFKESLKKSEKPSDEQIGTTISDSKNMLNQFIPEERG